MMTSSSAKSSASWVLILAMVLAVPSTAFASPIKLESKMITLPNPDPGGAACLDGSPYAFYIVPGSSASFSIGIHGGGWCYDEIDCLERSKTALGTSTLWNATSCFSPPVGVLLRGRLNQSTLWRAHPNPSPSPSPAPSPSATGRLRPCPLPLTTNCSPVLPIASFNCNGMANCTMVFMPYCDGSSFTADRRQPWAVPNTTTPQHLLFRGRRNLARTLDILAQDWGLGDAADVVLYGGSAGGLSTYLNLDYVQQRLPAARVVGMPVAGYFLDHAPAPFAAPIPPYQPPFQQVPRPYSSYPQAIHYMVGMHNSTGQLDPECRARFGLAEEWKCAMAPHMHSFVKAPFFAVQSRFDEWQLGPGE